MWKQVAAGLIASGIYLLGGIDEGYSSNILHQENIKAFSFQIDDNGLSWIASAMIISMPIGSICSGPLMYHFGRKKILFLMCFISLLGWILILGAQSIFILCVGRSLNGFAVGMEGATIMYVSEISGNPEYRGCLLSMAAPVVGLGTVISFILGSFLTEQLYSICICCISLMFLGLTFFIPESPVWLIQKNDLKGAIQSLEWLQRTSTDIEENNEPHPVGKHTDKPLITRIMLTKAWKPYLYLTIGCFLQVLSGFPAMIFYAANIYQSMNAPVDFSLSAIALVSVQTLAYICLTIFINRLDRRTWCTISAFGLFISFTTIAVYELIFYGSDTKPIFWLPLVCFWMSSMFGCLGMFTIPWIQMGEVFPETVKDFMSSMQLMTAFTLQFVSIKAYPLLESVIQIHGIFAIFSIASLLSILYSRYLMPETRCKTLDEIEKMWL